MTASATHVARFGAGAAAAVLDHDTSSILVVDDTPDIRMLLRIVIEAEGDMVVVGEAENGLEGVEAAGRLQPDLVLLDLAMPVMDGLEALPMIKRVAPGARVVVLSGFGAEAMAARAVQAGADSYLQKGTPPDGIMAALRELLPRAEPDPLPPVTDLRLSPEPARADLAAEPDVAARTAADLAPCGLVLVEDVREGGGRIAYLNAAATEALGTPASPPELIGHDLSAVSRTVAELLWRRLPELRAVGVVHERVRVGAGVLGLTLRCTPREADPEAVGMAGVEPHDQVAIAISPVPPGAEADRLRQAISTTAHEIRNPVTIIAGATNALEKRAGALEAGQHTVLLDSIRRQAITLDRVTDDLLTAAQAQRGSLRVDVGPVELAAVVEGAASDLADREVSIRGVQEISVLADQTRLCQMLSNLLGNAVKYGEPPYAVRACRIAHDGAAMVRIEVEDCGDGVPEAFRDHLFEEFSRARPAQARGTGLGLFVVRTLAEQQGGWASHRPREGGGSVFSIVLREAGGRSPQTGRPDSA